MSEPYSTTGGIPTQGDCFRKLIHHLQEAQNQTAMLSNLHQANDSPHQQQMARGWLVITDMLKQMEVRVTDFAARKI